jgi:hypothetical protein
MHGIVFAELQKFVTHEMGEDSWNQLLREAGLTGKVYMPITEYPDAEIGALVSTAVRLTGKTAGMIQESFGEFIAPDLLGMYRTLIQPQWKTLEVLENTERAIHEVVRIRNAGAQPPRLHVQRRGADQVLITYSSRRKMCALAVGIARGIAKHFQEEVGIKHIQCMLTGAPTCEIEVTKLSLRDRMAGASHMDTSSK